MFLFHCWETLAEIGSARFLKAARLVFPGHLHELAGSKDGGAAWQGLGCALQDHGNVGSWVLGELKKKSNILEGLFKSPNFVVECKFRMMISTFWGGRVIAAKYM